MGATLICGYFFNIKYELTDSSLLSDYNGSRISTEFESFVPLPFSNSLRIYLGYFHRQGNYDYIINIVPMGYLSNLNKNQIF